MCLCAWDWGCRHLLRAWRRTEQPAVGGSAAAAPCPLPRVAQRTSRQRSGRGPWVAGEPGLGSALGSCTCEGRSEAVGGQEECGEWLVQRFTDHRCFPVQNWELTHSAAVVSP